MHVQHAIAALPGVEKVDVFLTSEKAIIHLDPQLVDLPAIRKAVQGAGYSVPEQSHAAQVKSPAEESAALMASSFTRSILTLFGVVFGVVLFIIVVGEWLGLFETITQRVPWPIGLAIVLLVVIRSSATCCAPPSKARSSRTP
jgi:cation transport ATPase